MSQRTKQKAIVWIYYLNVSIVSPISTKIIKKSQTNINVVVSALQIKFEYKCFFRNNKAVFMSSYFLKLSPNIGSPISSPKLVSSYHYYILSQWIIIVAGELHWHLSTMPRCINSGIASVTNLCDSKNFLLFEYMLLDLQVNGIKYPILNVSRIQLTFKIFSINPIFLPLFLVLLPFFIFPIIACYVQLLVVRKILYKLFSFLLCMLPHTSVHWTS